MSVRVRLLGHPRVDDGSGRPCQAPRGKKSWAVLARVALAERPLPRGELAGELFAEADDPLGALRWCLADLRRCCADPRLLRGDQVSLAPGSLWLDVWALWDGTLPAAEIGGELLAGAEPRNCSSFDIWLTLARSRCAARSMEELRQAALRLLAKGEPEAAAEAAGRAAALDPLDEGAQELFLRTLVAAGHPARATVHLASCEAAFAKEAIVPSPALRAAARPSPAAPATGLRAGVVAGSLRRAGTAALDAGLADAGIETLRRAAEEAERAEDRLLHADVLRTLGSALVHSVRGFDGEGAVVLHCALAAAKAAGSTSLVAEILRELAFVDVQAGRHTSADRALREATAAAETVGDPALWAGLLAIRGMNEADLGRHEIAAGLLTESAQTARSAGRRRQEAWSTGVLARSLLLAGRVEQARAAAERSIDICDRDRWNAFLPWPQALRAHCLAADGQWDQARDDAEQAFALACQLGDPCWEGMAGRAIALLALHDGRGTVAMEWVTDAQRRSDRVSDRYVWVSGYVTLAHLEIAARLQPDLVLPLARRLYQDAVRADLPEFTAWALIYQAEAGDTAQLPLARAVASQVVSPALQERAAALTNRVKGGPMSWTMPGLRRLTPSASLILVAAAGAWAGVAVVARHMGSMPGTMGLGISAFAAVWTLMMAAMMLPSVTPFALLYSRTLQDRRGRRLTAFACGYLIMWALAALPAYGLAWLAGWLVDGHAAAASVLAVAIFAACGVYQLTPLKDRCLARCRSPLGFVLKLGGYRGRTRDLRVGLYHGAYCLACCWALMALLIAFGLMNVIAMVVLAGAVLTEKAWVWGPHFSRVLGVAALGLAVTAVFVPGLAPGLHQMANPGQMGGM